MVSVGKRVVGKTRLQCDGMGLPGVVMVAQQVHSMSSCLPKRFEVCIDRPLGHCGDHVESADFGLREEVPVKYSPSDSYMSA